MSDALLIRNGRPLGGKPRDILSRNGQIVDIAEAISAPDATVEDVAGDPGAPGLLQPVQEGALLDVEFVIAESGVIEPELVHGRDDLLPLQTLAADPRGPQGGRA